ncbi:MAG: hypothetical protein GYB66_16085 [Chloroflexi bacterium]|nr:hypothetical protein [Chloroflexota bacterium]
MSVSAVGISATQTTAQERILPRGLWLRDRRWDLLFITCSVLLVPIPYLFYLFGTQLGLTSDFSRNLVNGLVALLVGGPHMYATFMRTTFDRQFIGRYPMLVRSAVIIPIVVLSLAFLNLTLLLAIFFFWALIHVLHQATYIVELYNHRRNQQDGVNEDKQIVKLLSKPSRLIDYAVIMTSMAPVAGYKISQGEFNIGTNDLMAVIPGFFQQTWLFALLSLLFGIALVAYIYKTYQEYRGGYIHWPKTIFISLTVLVSFFVPALPNLDTAFQGMNTWHSFQYLVLTFYILKLREQRGELETSSRFISRMARRQGTSGLYMTAASMLVASLVLGAVVYLLAWAVDPANAHSNQHFDSAYYSAVLCFLWIHYYYDHFLFTDFEAIDP